MTYPRLLLGALGAAALATAGCGGSSSSGDDAKPAASAKAATTAASMTAAPTKADYVRRADALCRQAQKIGAKANAAVHQAFNEQAPLTAAEAIDRYSPAFAAKVKALHRLPQPTENRKTLAQLLRVLDAQVITLGVEADALRRRDKATLESVIRAQTQVVQSAEGLGKAYGFKVCGRRV